ncbi:MAG: hypothetical protein NT159_18805 [Proteobacteria bacterium]|nr:hypothetical protein [Pseudomonadota bacterium]
MTRCTRMSAYLVAILPFLTLPSMAATDGEVDDLFAWAEINLPQLLSPAGTPSQVSGGYRYRYYSGTHDAIGYRADDNQIYYLGADGALLRLGDITPYLELARVPPGTAAEMKAYLDARAYSSWSADPAIRPSASVHFGNVRTWTNPTLKTSLATGNLVHPVGSAAIKELFGGGTQRRGWAAMVRTRAGSGGDGWYWYEIFDGQLVGEGQGTAQCASCHSAGTDFSCQGPGGCTTPVGMAGW